MKLFRRGGTSLPGLLVESHFPKLLTKLGKNYKKIILVTGTNGKTTSQKLITYLLESKGKQVVSNRSGANLIRGIASAMITDSNIFGKVRSNYAVFEVEEASMPILCKYISPSIIVITNLYRDQLDAYGEIIQTRQYFEKAILLSKKATLVLNGDDENVSSLANDVKNKVIFYKIRDRRVSELLFEKKYYRLKRSGQKRIVFAKNIRIENDLTTRFDVFGTTTPLRNVHFSSPGIHYIYNCLASIVAVNELVRNTSSQLCGVISSFEPAFGRGEIVKVQDKTLRILLVKNPASLTAILNTIKGIANLKLLVALNDNIADGTDVSWIWDAKCEVLDKSIISWIVLSGNRAADLNLRFKYMDLKTHIEIETNLQKALDIAISKLAPSETLYIIPTYTAMLEIRNYLGDIIKIKKFWQ